MAKTTQRPDNPEAVMDAVPVTSNQLVIAWHSRLIQDGAGYPTSTGKKQQHAMHAQGPTQQPGDGLTLGLEMEFLVPVMIEGQTDPGLLSGTERYRYSSPLRSVAQVSAEEAAAADAEDPDYDFCPGEDMAQRYVVDALMGGFLTCDPQQEVITGNTAEALLEGDEWESDSSSSAGSFDQPFRSKWVVKGDATVMEADGRGGYPFWVPVEVTTPVWENWMSGNLSLDKAAYCAAQSIRTYCRARINTSCGLHVHVGMVGRPFMLDEIKAMATLIWLSETRLRELYHPLRQFKDSPWTEPLSSAARLNITWGEYDRDSLLGGSADAWLSQLDFSRASDPDLKAKMSVLWRAKTINQLVGMLVGDGATLAYNFKELFQDQSDNKGTVEFRQMESTLDPDHINYWTDICYRLVDFCRLSRFPGDVQQQHGALVQGLASLAEKLLRNNNIYTVWHLLGELHVPADYIHWFRKKHLNDAMELDKLEVRYGPLTTLRGMNPLPYYWPDANVNEDGPILFEEPLSPPTYYYSEIPAASGSHT